MNFEDVKKAGRLIAHRKELQAQLKYLAGVAGFPCGYLSYGNNAGGSVNVSISVEMQPSIETLLHTILSSQISQIENELTALGVNVGEQNA